MYVDTMSLLCRDVNNISSCRVRVDDDMIFYDGDHFSLQGATFLGDKIFEKYSKKLKEFGIYE